MNTSIEQIWKEGFMDSNAMIAPKIIDLYNKKSKNIVDKMETMFKWNLIGIVIMAFIVLIVTSVQGIPFLGMFIFSLLISTVIYGKKELATLALLDKNVSSYQYLKSFDSWLKDLMISYAKLYSFLYPALFLGIMLQLRLSDIGLEAISGFVNAFPKTLMILATPMVILVPVAVIAWLLYYFAAPIYKADMYTLYGRALAKLDEIIADMEELKKA